MDYDGYNYEKFKELARNSSLSSYEKIGFPDSYRKGYEEKILHDIQAKCPVLMKNKNIKVLNIGPGCSDLQKMISDFCEIQGNMQILADCPEMLALIEDRPNEIKIPGLFPNTYDIIKTKVEKVDVIICYSVFHYIFVDSNVWHFLDCVMDLLRDGGECILGDIPNIDKRKRFFSSNNGILFHQNFMHTKEKPDVKFNCIEKGVIDEALLFAVIQKCHMSGYDAYIVPQSSDLPFSNRRDDIIIKKTMMK